MNVIKNNDMIESAYNALDGAYGLPIGLASIILLVLVVNFLLKWGLYKLHCRFKQKEDVWKDGFVKALYKPLSLYVWFFALVQISDILLFHFSGFTISEKHLILGIAFTAALGWFLLRWKDYVSTNYRIKARHKLAGFDASKIDVLDKVSTIAIAFLVGLILLEQTGGSMSTLIAFGGVSGLAIAFASQQLISNFFGGLMIYATHPFSIGDWIQLPEKKVEGHVEEIGWYMTRVRTFDKRPVYVPNSLLTGTMIVTPSRMTHRQFKQVIGLRYSDINILKTITKEIEDRLAKHPAVDTSATYSAYLTAFAPSSVDITIACLLKTLDGEEFNKVQEELLFMVADTISKHGAAMAFPTITLDNPK